MYEFWKQSGLDSALERFMGALESQAPPAGPPDVTAAIRLAHEDLLQHTVGLDNVADAAWQLRSRCQSGTSHDLALIIALYFLQATHEQLPSVSSVRLDARLLAQRWMTDGLASVGVVTRFEEALFQQFR